MCVCVCAYVRASACVYDVCMICVTIVCTAGKLCKTFDSNIWMLEMSCDQYVCKKLLQSLESTFRSPIAFFRDCLVHLASE